jgi:hypothetical protein
LDTRYEESSDKSKASSSEEGDKDKEGQQKGQLKKPRKTYNADKENLSFSLDDEQRNILKAEEKTLKKQGDCP